MKKKVCVECGNYFLAKVYNKRYCSGCEGANQKSVVENKKRMAKLDSRKCSFCNGYLKDCGGCKGKRLSNVVGSVYNLSKKFRWSILERDNFKCIYCGRSPIEDSVVLQVDHIFPLNPSSEFEDCGEFDNMNNLVTSCSECNVHKSNGILSEEILNRVKGVVVKRNKDLLS